MGTFGENLRKLREMRDITQEQLAEMADIARTMVGRYETTDQLPSLDTLMRLADALDTSTDYLLGRTDSPDEQYESNYSPPSASPHQRKPPCPAEHNEERRRIPASGLPFRRVTNNSS